MIRLTLIKSTKRGYGCAGRKYFYADVAVLEFYLLKGTGKFSKFTVNLKQ